MNRAAFPSSDEITRLQSESVERWHQVPMEQWSWTSADSRLEPFFALVSQQHECNFRLWHEEDKARSKTATDHQIAEVKRAIDRLNQQRNDLIEQIDDAMTEILEEAGVTPRGDAKQNTETPGSVIDRLSIMSLRIFHYREQSDQPGTSDAHKKRVSDRLELCRHQIADLTLGLQQLVDDLASGVKRHQTYRQMKMYNDPSLNPRIDGDWPAE